MSDERLAKLPKWVQDEIATSRRQRDEAVRRLDEMTNHQTPSPFYALELDTTATPPTPRKHYFQSRSTLTIEHLAGVEVFITLRDDCIALTWHQNRRTASESVFIRPQASNSIEIVCGTVKP